jgi:hypothetical protein
MAFTLGGLWFIWSAAEVTKDRFDYVLFGVGLMLYPMQWAFRLGQKNPGRGAGSF